MPITTRHTLMSSFTPKQADTTPLFESRFRTQRPQSLSPASTETTDLDGELFSELHRYSIWRDNCRPVKPAWIRRQERIAAEMAAKKISQAELDIKAAAAAAAAAAASSSRCSRSWKRVVRHIRHRRSRSEDARSRARCMGSDSKAAKRTQDSKRTAPSTSSTSASSSSSSSSSAKKPSISRLWSNETKKPHSEKKEFAISILKLVPGQVARILLEKAKLI